MSLEDHAPLIDNAQFAAEQEAITRICRRRGKGRFLAVYLTTKRQHIRVKAGETAAQARMALPDQVFRHGLWMMIQKDAHNQWVPVWGDSQFECLLKDAALQLASKVGKHWDDSLEESVRRHPAGKMAS